MRGVLLTTSAMLVILGLTTSLAIGDAMPKGVTYMLHENWGGTWSDTEKSPHSSEDDKLCWAAAASNILDWTGWGHVNDINNTDDMFAYFQDHWTDRGGQMTYAWQWWLEGVNPSDGWAGWSQVDIPGGGFHPSENYSSLYHETTNASNAMSAIDTYLRSGYGTTVGIYGPGGHALSVWGLTHAVDNPSQYNGLYVTDSDDYKYRSNAPDKLRYFEVEYRDEKWYLQSFNSSNSWYVGDVYALESAPPDSIDGDFGGNVPEPSTSVLIAFMGPLVLRRRSIRSCSIAPTNLRRKT
jgi:hypothetical protein